MDDTAIAILAVAAPFGVLLSIEVAKATFRLFRPSGRESWLRRAWHLGVRLVGLGALAVFVFLVAVAPFRPPKEAVRRIACRNNLSQIGRALANYEAVHRRFPPAYSTDKDGRRLHSWRVLLLPYLEQEALYKELRLDEPWDSPHNRAIFDANGMPTVFGCPSVSEAHKQETNYVMIVGPGTISDGPHAARWKEITDGTGNTIMVVEVADSGIHWAEPRDVKADAMSYRINDPDTPSISSRHAARGAHAVFADGTVRLLEESTDPETVKALITIAGGEDVSEYMTK